MGAMMAERSKLLWIEIRNLGCVGSEGLRVELDNIVCLVGRNNSGKSNVLRAYELAQGGVKYDRGRDFCQSSPPEVETQVELAIHIPEGIANIDAEWKAPEGPYLVVRSLWTWGSDGKATRKTWSPKLADWSDDGKAGGADNVFKSRLPIPIRIGSLQDADEAEKNLISLVFSSLGKGLNQAKDKLDHPIGKALAALRTAVADEFTQLNEQVEEVSSAIDQAFKGVFPDLSASVRPGVGTPTLKFEDLIKSGSKIIISDGSHEGGLDQQGSGARRALFWSVLQAYNDLKRKEDAAAKPSKRGARGKTEGASASAPAAMDSDDPALPGYILLIDEPENALHPMAARAAQKYLYKLAEDENWQVMLTTHSPYFVDPFADHTTIVRLHRESNKVSPQIYRADEITFGGDEKRQLQALQTMDPSFSEVFFGSYPIIVEGDTEHASFIAAVVEIEHILTTQVSILRARGKAIIPAIICMLRHFKVSFGVVHDSDFPFTNSGDKSNPMWTVNLTIREAVEKCRTDGLSVRHRISFPDFERWLGGSELGKDKPLQAYLRVSGDGTLSANVQKLFEELRNGVFDSINLSDHDCLTCFLKELAAWAEANGASGDARLIGKVSTV
ncbi:ATP-dependent nuclease [Salinarimonas sp. NSM]|uniref:ATP-dependent nuclease n=1 Tax=Salinarimonas sp. NSM TaxID=3458003 RepID=UPI004035D1BB